MASTVISDAQSQAEGQLLLGIWTVVMLLGGFNIFCGTGQLSELFKLFAIATLVTLLLGILLVSFQVVQCLEKLIPAGPQAAAKR